MTFNLRSKLKASAFLIALAFLLFGLSYLPLMSAFSYEAALATALIGLFAIPLSQQWLFKNPSETRKLEKLYLSSHLRALVFFAMAIMIALMAALRAGELCNLTEGLNYFLVLTLPSNLLAAGLYFALQAQFPKNTAKKTCLIYASIVFFSFAWTLWKLYHGPAIVAFGHFYGYFAGSIYDENIDVIPALIKYRLGSVLIYAALVLPQVIKLRNKAKLAVALCLLGTAISWTLFLSINGDTIHQGRKTLHSDLWMQIENSTNDLPNAKAQPAIRIHFVPTSKKREHIATQAHDLLQDALKDYRYLENFFAGQCDKTLDIWLYPNTNIKAQHIGARNTSIARVWKNELHLPVVPRRSSLLRHEMAHSFAGSFAHQPLKLAGPPLRPKMGWVEGLAMAAEWPKTPYTLHQWSAAILAKEGLNYRHISGKSLMSGFWLLPSRIAYTLAGSYVRWLIDKHGIETVKELSRSNRSSFSKILGLSFEESFEQWKTAILAEELKPKVVLRVAQAFDTKSLFTRQCARQKARQRMDLIKCLNSNTCSLQKLENYCPAQKVSELDNMWLVYLYRGALSTMKIKDKVNFVKTSASQQRQVLTRFLLEAQKYNQLSPQLNALWAERVVDLLWHGELKSLAKLSCWTLKHTALMPAQERRLALKYWALKHKNNKTSHDLRAYFAAANSKESLKTLTKASRSNAILYLQTINAVEQRDFEIAAEKLARLLIAMASTTKAQLPRQILRQIPHIAAEIYPKTSENTSQNKTKFF